MDNTPVYEYEDAINFIAKTKWYKQGYYWKGVDVGRRLYA